jgi:hypothetical protein
MLSSVRLHLQHLGPLAHSLFAVNVRGPSWVWTIDPDGGLAVPCNDTVRLDVGTVAYVKEM